MPIAGAWYTRFQYTDPFAGAITVSLPFPTDAISINIRRVAGRSITESGIAEEVLTRVDFFVTLAWVARPRQIVDTIAQIMQTMGTRPITITLDYQGSHNPANFYDVFNTYFTRGELQETELPITPANPPATLFSTRATFRQGHV